MNERMDSSNFRFEPQARFDAAAWIASFGALALEAGVRPREDGIRKDANDPYFLSPQLEQVLTELWNVEYPELLGRAHVPMVPGADGAASVKYRGYDRTGVAKIKGQGGTDMPYADVSGHQAEAPYRTFWLGCKYDLDELRAAAYANQPIDRDKMQAVRDGMELLIDDLLCFGDANTNMTGLLNNANAELVAVTTGTWATATSQQIFSDFAEIHNKIVTDTRGIHRPNRARFPMAIWTLLTTKTFGTDNNSDTLLTVLQKNYPWVDFAPWPVLNTADAARTGPRVLVYKADRQILWSAISREPMPEAPQLELLDFKVPWHGRMVPGVVMPRPLGVKYCDNAA